MLAKLIRWPFRTVVEARVRPKEGLFPEKHPGKPLWLFPTLPPAGEPSECIAWNGVMFFSGVYAALAARGEPGEWNPDLVARLAALGLLVRPAGSYTFEQLTARHKRAAYLRKSGESLLELLKQRK